MAFRPYWLDASALVKLVHQETGSKHVRRVVGRESWFETTWLCVAEAYGVLKRLLNKGRIAPNDYHKKLSTLRSWIDSGRITVRLEWLLPGKKGPDKTIFVREFAKKHGLDFSDAIQFFELTQGAISAVAGKSVPVVVSSDRKLLAAARKLGHKVWDPEKDEEPPS